MFKSRNSYRIILLLIPLLSLALHFHVFRLDLIGYHVWRQTQTQTVVKNFYREDMNILNPRINDKPDTDRIMRMEFPVMQWLFACSHKFFGENIAISRMLTFLIGLFSVWGIFRLSDAVFGHKWLAALAAWTFNWSPVFYYYTVNPLPDNLALCCGIWSMAFFFRYFRTGSWVHVFFSAFFLLVATLAKLPFVLYGAVPAFYFLYLLFRDRDLKKPLVIAATYLILIVPALLWYLWVVPGWGASGIVTGVLDNELSFLQMADILRHHFISTLPELLLNYGSVLFFIAGFYFMVRKKLAKGLKFQLLCIWSAAVFAYFFFELNMIEKVHDYYLFPFLPLLFLVVSFGAWNLLQLKNRALRILAVVALCVLPLTAFLRADTRWDVNEPGFHPVYYKHREYFRKLVPADAYVIAGNDDSHFILLYHLDRKGWTFDHDQLSGTDLESYRKKGARFLFTDAPVDRREDIQPQLERKVFEEDGVRVYQLKQ